MTTPQMDWLDDQRRKRAVSSDEQTFTKCCQGCDPSCDGPAACADRAWTEIERLRAEVERLRAAVADDIVTRLRQYAYTPAGEVFSEAANEIERLCKCNNDLQARIDWLITTYSSYGEDGIFVFPDGEYWEVNRG